MDTQRQVRWAGAAVVVLLTAAVAVVIYALAIEATARSILTDVSALTVGVSSIEQVEAIAARHSHWIQERSCDGSKCFFRFEVYNTWLYRLKLEPVARFQTSVKTLDGVVDSIFVDLSRDTRAFPTSSSGGATSEYRTIPERFRGYNSTSYWFPTPVGKPYLWVALTTQADAVQREHAYAYSLKCLVKPGRGCDLPCDYLPLAWHDWENELLKDGFGFGPYYPMRGRCP